ncbi:MFS transporter [Arthrobacter sp. MYb23]|nr:MFS transporter [Arthrobacter sp. MYb51]PRB98020.1 MFS transporter [Arthrobacter sp. MYb23]
MRPLLATVVMAFTGFSLLLPISPAWVIAGGATELGAGAVTALLMLFTIIAQLRVNLALVRFGWAPVLAAGVTLLALPAPLQALTSDLTLVLVSSALRGLGFGILTVCGATALTLLVPESQRGRAVGAYGLAVALPQLAFASSAPMLSEVLSPPAVLTFGAVPLLALTWIFPLGRRLTALAVNAHERADAAPRSFVPVMALVWTSLLALVLTTSVGGALLTFSDQIAPSPGLATAALLCFTGFAAPARWAAAALSDRPGARWVIPGLVLTTALGAAGIIASLVIAGSIMGVVWLLAGATLLGLAYGGLQSATMVRAFRDAGPQNAARASVMWNVTFDLGTGAGALLVGALAQGTSFAVAFGVASVVAILGAAFTRERTK